MTKYTNEIKLAIVRGYNPDLVSESEYAMEMGLFSKVKCFFIVRLN